LPVLRHRKKRDSGGAAGLMDRASPLGRQNSGCTVCALG